MRNDEAEFVQIHREEEFEERVLSFAISKEIMHIYLQ